MRTLSNIIDSLRPKPVKAVFQQWHCICPSYTFAMLICPPFVQPYVSCVPKYRVYETLWSNASWLISKPRKLAAITEWYSFFYSPSILLSIRFPTAYLGLCCGGSKLNRNVLRSPPMSCSVPWPDGICIPSRTLWVCPEVVFLLDMSRLTSQGGIQQAFWSDAKMTSSDSFEQSCTPA